MRQDINETQPSFFELIKEYTIILPENLHPASVHLNSKCKSKMKKKESPCRGENQTEHLKGQMLRAMSGMEETYSHKS